MQYIVKVVFGCVAAVACGMLYAIYLSTYHDRKFWFSTRRVGDGILWVCSICFERPCHINSELQCVLIKELEREITFQEGSGLYYYYYKHMLAAPLFERGTVASLFLAKKDFFKNLATHSTKTEAYLN